MLYTERAHFYNRYKVVFVGIDCAILDFPGYTFKTIFTTCSNCRKKTLRKGTEDNRRLIYIVFCMVSKEVLYAIVSLVFPY